MSRARRVVEVVARALADDPNAVSVAVSSRRDGERLELSTAPGDLGRIIGRRGRTASALRLLAALAAELDGTNVTLEFRDEPR